ncbi:MAG TPA: hypothetical protein ENG00_00255 [Candidatus Aenigmarchaeota archaeon]|nr:hypothetical protein [Candidatus Aenigmarchaeota archaeon]
MMEPRYKNLKQEREDYISKDIDELSPRVFPEGREIEREVIREVKVRRHAMPRMEEETIRPLQRKTPQVFGSLFDRVKFLKQRIAEIHEAMETRKKLHEEMIRDIESDISEKNSMVNMITDIDEKREFKLDISLLRKEKRAENVNFWRDMTELRTELRELLEQYETEVSILNLFKDMEGKNDTPTGKDDI